MSNSSPSFLDTINDRFFDLSDREKYLVLLAGAFLIFIIGFVFFIEPSMKATERYEQQLQRQKSLATQLDIQIDELNEELKQDPNIPLRERLDGVNDEILALDNALTQQTSDLVPAEKMPELLESMLASTENLTLVELRSIPPQRLIDPESPNADDPELSSINLFQHGVSLKLKGQYFDIQAYLERVEQLPWRFYWKTFDYQVEAYPQALVEIQLYTLSTSEAFIGVNDDN